MDDEKIKKLLKDAIKEDREERYQRFNRNYNQMLKDGLKHLIVIFAILLLVGFFI